MSRPYYITLADVKVRLFGKVNFATAPPILTENNREINASSPQGSDAHAQSDIPLAQDIPYSTYDPLSNSPIGSTQKLTDDVLASMVVKAEMQVARDFSPFYVIPLQGIEGETWNFMQQDGKYQYPVEFFKNAFIVQACLEVCKYEFGRNSNVNGESIIKFLADEYKEMMKKIYLKNKSGRYLYPPFPLFKTTPYVQYESQALGFPRPRLAGTEGVNSMLYANKHMNNPMTNWFSPWGDWPSVRRYDAN